MNPIDYIKLYLERRLVEKERKTKGPDICICLRCWEKRYGRFKMCFAHMKRARRLDKRFKPFEGSNLTPIQS